jgi:hypothetical protein
MIANLLQRFRRFHGHAARRAGQTGLGHFCRADGQQVSFAGSGENRIEPLISNDSPFDRVRALRRLTYWSFID